MAEVEKSPDPGGRIPSSARRLTVSAWAGMFVFGIVMAVLGAILPELFRKVGFSKGEAANLFLVMNFAMLVMSFLFGPFVDRFGFKKLLVISSLLVSLSILSLALAGSYGFLVAAVAVLGFAGGGLNGGTNTLTSDVNPERRGAALNVLGVFFGFGALTVPFLIGMLLDNFGLGQIIYFIAGLSVIPLILFATAVFPAAKQAQGFPFKRAAAVAGSPVLWLGALILFFQSGNEFTVGGWISSYLQESFGLTAAAAALSLAGYWAAIMTGRLFATRLVSLLGNTRLIMATSAAACLAAGLLRFSGSGWTVLVAAVLIGLAFAAVYPTTLAVIGGQFPELSGTAFSVALVVGLTGGMTSPWLAGKIAQTQGLREAFIIPVIYCAAIVLLGFLLSRLQADKGSAA